jgi:putative transposase
VKEKGKSPLGSTGFQPVFRKRTLPVWEIGGSAYFLTFRTKGIELPAAARQIILQACRYHHGSKYQLWAAVVMTDHAHLLLSPLEVQKDEWHSLASILHSIRSFTANKVNRCLGRHGALWQEDYFNRIVRDDAEFLEKWNYIRNNPVKQDLCEHPEEWDAFSESNENPF